MLSKAFSTKCLLKALCSLSDHPVHQVHASNALSLLLSVM